MNNNSDWCSVYRFHHRSQKEITSCILLWTHMCYDSCIITALLINMFYVLQYIFHVASEGSEMAMLNVLPVLYFIVLLFFVEVAPIRTSSMHWRCSVAWSTAVPQDQRRMSVCFWMCFSRAEDTSLTYCIIMLSGIFFSELCTNWTGKSAINILARIRCSSTSFALYTRVIKSVFYKGFDRSRI